MKYVSPLSSDEIARLKGIRKNALSSRVRDRAHCILLSARGYGIKEIADIFGTDRRTVSSWTDRWEKSCFAGLPDSPRSVLTEEEKKTAERLIRENPRSLRTAVRKVFEASGKTVSSKKL